MRLLHLLSLVSPWALLLASLVSLGAAAAGICFALCYALIQAKIKPQQELSQRLRSIEFHEEDGKARTLSSRATQRGRDDIIRDDII